MNVVRSFASLLALARGTPPVVAAFIHPTSELALRSALEARDLGLVVPLLVGPEARIRSTAAEHGLDLGGIEIIATAHSHAAVTEAARLARENRVQILVKGAIATDELMHGIVGHDSGMRTDRRMSHVFAIEVARYPKLLLITDAALNVLPDLATKRDIVQNAIELAHALQIDRPKVAILSAQEKVKPLIPSTIDAAALCKMADRGQITGALLDGPLAFDNAISAEAARAKGIASPVAGDADILVTPDLEAGNMLAKQLSYLADARLAGVVLGARLPIALSSRAEKLDGRVMSIALAKLAALHKEAGALT